MKVSNEIVSLITSPIFNMEIDFTKYEDRMQTRKEYTVKVLHAYFLLSADDLHKAISADWIFVNNVYYRADKNQLVSCYSQLRRSKAEKMKFHLRLEEIKNPYE